MCGCFCVGGWVSRGVQSPPHNRWGCHSFLPMDEGGIGVAYYTHGDSLPCPWPTWRCSEPAASGPRSALAVLEGPRFLTAHPHPARYQTRQALRTHSQGECIEHLP